MTRCVRRDGSAYGTGGKCRLGVEQEKPEWAKKWYGRSPELDRSLDKMRSTLNSLPEKDREVWDRRIKEDLLNPKVKSKHGVPYGEDRINSMVSSHAKAWVQMMEEGAPTTLVRFGDRSEFPAPKGMIPRVVGGSSGIKTWINPENGAIYNHKPGGKATQSRATNEDRDRRSKDLASFKKERESSNQTWPARTLEPQGEKKDFDEVWKSLSKAQVSRVALNGLDPTGFDFRAGLANWYNSNPNIKEQRAKDVVRRWVEQDGRSGVTGKPVAIPGLPPKKGEERSSTDHFNPLSGASAKMSFEQIRRDFDNFDNYMVAEPAFNQGRGNRKWSAYAKKFESSNFTEAYFWVEFLRELQLTNEKRRGS